ncbi:hypothetical protein LTR96_007223 [Exophiala xenobiotica]|nr:hypothetical protein LTS06_011559 [Exophiala xenobiotica]KAK5259964.1 hypothetical protein LTR40_004997 [Exophiala xenobiotica]KAK5267190.1 hypothetical protein LTR96_007223 [Exophiala xenobiotica]KAK5334928.1 hypothetical protein LTR98_008648 [Exophiala xenobiotica]KAK5378988.1 hypothetical protein LTS13_003880 [Exophiala xenobiotica]
MAEILGVVAGGAGLASLAVQLLECLHKLHDLHANIRDAPVEIREILDEVDLLGHVLTGYLGASGGATGTCLVPTVVQKKALDQCSKVLESLRNIAHELETTMQTSRTKRWVNWAKVEAASKRKQLQRLQTALERAKSTLNLAINLAILIHQSPQHCVPGNAITREELPVNVPPDTVKVVTVTPEAIVARPRCGKSNSSVAMHNLGIAMVMIRSKIVPPHSEAENNGHEDNREVFISLGSWLFNRAVALISHSSRNRIEMTLRIDRLVRPDAEIFHLCAAGDALGVRKLIADGKASASDVTYEGITLLMVAAYYLQADVCRALLDAGADVTITAPVKLLENATFQMTALNVALTGLGVSKTTLTALKGYANPWKDYWVTLSSKSESDKQSTITTLNTVRVLVEHGGSSIDYGWSLPSVHDLDLIDILGCLTPAQPVHMSLCALEDLLWLIAPDRINLLEQELDLFYISMFITECGFWNSRAFSAQRVSALFQKVTDLSMLAHVNAQYQTCVLHHLLAWLPYLEDGHLRIILQILDQLIHVGALEIADSMEHFTPVMWAAGMSSRYYVSKYGIWRPEHASEILASGLNLWLETLGSAGVDILQYFTRQRNGATEPIPCYVDTDDINECPEHFLDQEWWVELEFWENPDATEANNPRDFRIGVKYHPVQCKFPLPGAWSEETEQDKQQSDQDDVQLRVEELDIEGDDDQDGNVQDCEGSDGDVADENCDAPADPD